MNAILTQLQGYVDKARAAKNKGGVWNWAQYIFWASVVSLGVAFVMYQLNKRNGELAKLRTQAEIDDVKAATARHAALIQPRREDLKRLAGEAVELTNAANRSKALLRDAQAETDAHVEQALNTRDWASLDAANAKGRGQ
jgi:hypothetical protein